MLSDLPVHQGGECNAVGLHTANEFAANEHDVTVFHRNQYTGSDLSIKVRHILGDRLKVEELSKALRENDPNHRFRPFVEQITQGSVAALSSEMGVWTSSKGYAKDIAYGIYLAACKGQPGEIYNLAEQEPVSESEWFKRIAELMYWKGKIEIKGKDTSGGNWNQDLTMDTQKIRSASGYSEKYSVERFLKNTLK